MWDLKKRVGALIPRDSARGALQNVLTVEWSGHKTVLVDVPSTSDSSKSNDVEMLGMGSTSTRDYSNYGRLDDDEEERAYLDQSNEIPLRDPRLSRSGLSSTSNRKKPQKSLPPLLDRPAHRSQSENPFYTPEPDDFSPPRKPAYTDSQSYDGSRRVAATTGFSEAPRSIPTRFWTSFGGGGGGMEKTSTTWKYG